MQACTHGPVATAALASVVDVQPRLFHACTIGRTCARLRTLAYPAGLSSSFSNCSTVFRFYWFAFAFVTVTIISILLATGSKWGLHYARPSVTSLVTICVVLMMIASEAFTGYETVYDSFALNDWWHARFRSTCAGAIMTVVWLILTLMAVGTE